MNKCSVAPDLPRLGKKHTIIDLTHVDLDQSDSVGNSATKHVVYPTPEFTHKMEKNEETQFEVLKNLMFAISGFVKWQKFLWMKNNNFFFQEI